MKNNCQIIVIFTTNFVEENSIYLLCVRSTPYFKNDTNLNSTNLVFVVFAF